LLVRIKTILKRTIEPKNENILTYKNIKLDIEKEIIFV
jgi:hypothetical protein